MKKFPILVLAISLTAASCNLFGGGSGTKGILKSEDGGKSFQAANALEKKGNINGLSVTILTQDAKNPDTLYIGVANGIYKTLNAGKTWGQILAGINVSDIASDPNISNVIYAAGLAGKNGKVIKSTDGGASWTDIYTEPSKSNTVTTVAVSKANSRIILAGLSTGEVIRSTDEGKTWQPAKDFQDNVLRIRYYDSSTAYALTLTKGLNKSTDQGANWTSYSLTNVTVPGSTSSSNVKRFLDMAFDQRLSGVIFLATQQGLIRSIDDGVTWSVIYLPVKDTSLKVTAVSVNPNDSNTLYIAVGSTLFKSTNGGVTWETNKLPSAQTVRQILVNPVSSNIVYLGMGDSK